MGALTPCVRRLYHLLLYTYAFFVVDFYNTITKLFHVVLYSPVSGISLTQVRPKSPRSASKSPHIPYPPPFKGMQPPPPLPHKRTPHPGPPFILTHTPRSQRGHSGRLFAGTRLLLSTTCRSSRGVGIPPTHSRIGARARRQNRQRSRRRRIRKERIRILENIVLRPIEKVV